MSRSRRGGRVLVDHRRSCRAVAHPGHEVGEARAGIGGQRVASVPQVVEVEAGQADSGHRLAPLGGTLEVGPGSAAPGWYGLVV
jgi:hypothetical protein